MCKWGRGDCRIKLLCRKKSVLENKKYIGHFKMNVSAQACLDEMSAHAYHVHAHAHTLERRERPTLLMRSRPARTAANQVTD